MKVRVLGILSVIAVLIVVTVSSVILTSAARELTQDVQINRVSALNRFAQLANDASADGDNTQLQREMDRYAELYGEGILIRLQQQTLASGGLSEQRRDVQDAWPGPASTSATPPSAQSGPSKPGRRSSRALSERPMQVLGEAVAEVNLDAARAKLRERWVVVGLAALVMGAVLLLVAARLTGWVLRPVHRLSEAVHQLETTGKTSKLPEAGPPELRELSRSFSAMANTVSESMESQRQLIADTSHQLRNPVGALRLRIDLLQLELQNSPAKAAAAGVVDELERVEEMLDGVLKLATAEHRAVAGAAAAQSSEHRRQSVIDPFPVLQGEVERAAPAARLAGSTITLEDHTGHALELRCDPEELAQMVGELLANAIKYSPGGHIAVAAEATRDGLAIEVSDDGPGLSTDQRLASTSRFWRAPQHSGIPGNGLGLTIVERLAEANGGRLVLRERVPHGLIGRLEFGGGAND